MPRVAHFLAALVLGAAPEVGAQPSPAPDVFVRPDKGHCAACHQLPDGVAPATRADLGPRLEGARMRDLGKAGLREILHDPTRANPDTVMPPFGRHLILEAAEIERLVEFLHALP
jgi:L-cysteine S-thiosulfotransferase